MKKLIPLLLLFSCSLWDSRNLKAKLDDFFSSQFPEDAPGGAVLIAKDTLLLLSKGYGLADLNIREMITSKTLINVGSITKTFVANAILILRDQGKLSVEDSLFKYFPDFKNKEIAKKVKIKHLLTHTSGLPDNREVDKDSVFYLTAGDAENWYPLTQTDTLEFEPGSKFHYSNPAYNALALIVEKVSGQKWQDFVREKIFIPSGMESSTITDGSHPAGGVAHGYRMVRDQWQEYDYGEEPTFCAAGNSGVWSSVEELNLYHHALQHNTFLDRESIKESTVVRQFQNWSEVEPAHMGWSWFIGQTPDGNMTIGHSGSMGGFQSNYISIPEQEILIVILCNSPRDLVTMTKQVVELLAENHYGENLILGQ